MPDMIVLGEVWPESLANERNLPAGVTGWVSLALDGSREIFYGRFGYVGLLSYYRLQEHEYLSHQDFPPPVAVAVPWEGLHAIPQLEPLPHRLWIDYDWATLSTEPVNQGTDFFTWRSHISKIAHEARFDVRDFHAEDPGVRRIDHDRLQLLPGERVSVGNASESVRSWCGQLWWEIHDYASLHPVNDRVEWRRRRPLLQARMDALCVVCGGEGWDRYLTVEHPEDEWEQPLSDGLRLAYHPETLHPVVLVGEPIVTDAVFESNVRNFVTARRWHEVSHRPATTPHFPPNTAAEQTPPSPVLPVLDGEHSARRTGAAAWWRRKWDYIQSLTAVTNEQRALYWKWATVALLAELRPENHASTDSVARMVLNRLDPDYLIRNTAPYLAWFSGTGAPWEFGYPRLDLDVKATTYVHDYDPTHYYAVRPPIAQHRWDPRVNNRVVMIAESEIDRSAGDTVVANLHPWTAQAEWTTLINQILMGQWTPPAEGE